MKVYEVKYRDKYDFACPVFSYRTRAYNVEHVELKFYDSDDDGWEIVSVKEVKP